MNPFLYSYLYHFPRVVAKTIVRKQFRKDSARVFEHYEAMRQRSLEKFRVNRPSLDEFITTYATPPQLQLLDDRPSWDLKSVRLRFIDDLAARVERYKIRDFFLAYFASIDLIRSVIHLRGCAIGWRGG